MYVNPINVNVNILEFQNNPMICPETIPTPIDTMSIMNVVNVVIPVKIINISIYNSRYVLTPIDLIILIISIIFKVLITSPLL